MLTLSFAFKIANENSINELTNVIIIYFVIDRCGRCLCDFQIATSHIYFFTNKVVQFVHFIVCSS